MKPSVDGRWHSRWAVQDLSGLTSEAKLFLWFQLNRTTAASSWCRCRPLGLQFARPEGKDRIILDAEPPRHLACRACLPTSYSTSSTCTYCTDMEHLKHKFNHSQLVLLLSILSQSLLLKA